MAKPDPTPKFIEIKSAESPHLPEVSITEKQTDWVDQFLGDREIRPNTRKVYQRQLRQFQRWLHFKPWEQVLDTDFTRYKAYLKTKPTPYGNGLKPASINQALASIQSFFRWLSAKRYISYNPALNIEKVAERPIEAKDLDIKTVHQLAEGIAYRGQLSTRDDAILWVMKHGLRGKEISDLNIGDYKDSSLKVDDAKWGSDGIVPLCPAACQAIESYLGWCITNEFDTASNQPLFRSQSNRNYGQRISYRAIYNLVKDLQNIAGIEESVHPHRLRHTFGVQMLMEEMPPEYARKLMRIKSPQTFERYTKRAMEQKSKEAFEDVIAHSKSGLFGQPQNTPED